MRATRDRAWVGACALLTAALTVPGCGPEGAGTIHAERSGASTVMVLPDRKAPGPPQPRSRDRRLVTRSRSTQQLLNPMAQVPRR